MATRYWVGGAGTWDASSTTNWSATSGGASGASAPTSADDVIFDTNSGTGTIAFSGVCVCKNLTVTATQAITFGAGTLYGIYGSLSLPIGGSFSWTGVPVAFRSTTTGNTLNWGDKSTTQAVTFDGVGGAWTLASAMTNAAIIVTNGSFSTNNFNVSTSGLSSSNSNTRTINLGSSTVTLTGDTAVDFTNTINLTFNAGTSTILVTSSSTPTFAGGGRTFYNVSYTGGGAQTATLGGANTFNNFSVTATTTGTRGINFSANQTINGTLSVSGTTATQRVQFGSSAAGTQRTLSVATAGTLTNTNFKDIALTGAASPWTAPMSAYDLGNNSGITFDTTTLYWVGGAGGWSDSTHWSTSSGGAGGAGVPGPTNSVILDANSGSGTVSGNSGNPINYCKNFDCSASSVSTAFSNMWLYCYGNLKAKSGVSFAVAILNFYGSGTHTVDPNGATAMAAGGGFAFSGSGTYTLMNNWVSGNAFFHYAGTLNTNGYSISTNAFSSTGTITRTLTLGNSTITSSGTLDFGTSSALTLNAGTSTLYHRSTSAFNSPGLTFYTLIFDGASNDQITVNGANTFTNLTVINNTGAGIKSLALVGNTTVTGTLTLAGQEGYKRTGLRTSLNGARITVTAAAVSLTDADFHGIACAGAATWSGTRVGNAGFNTGLTAATPKTVYWSLAAGGNFLTAIAWATTSGGTPDSLNFPLAQDTAVFNDTALNSGATITNTLMGSMFLPNLDMSSRTLPMTYSAGGTNWCGNITLSSAVTWTGTQIQYIINNTTLNTAGVSITNYTYLWYSGSLTLASNATFTMALTNGFQMYGGGFDITSSLSLGSYTLTAFALSQNGNTNINFGTGKYVVSGNAATVLNINYGSVFSGSKSIELTYSGATGTRTFNSSSLAETSRPNIKITAGADTINTNAMQIGDLDFTGFSGTLTNTARFISGNLTISTGMTLTAGTNETTFAATSGTKTITTNGKTLDFPITFNGVGGTWQLADNLTQGSTRTTSMQAGALDLNGKTLTVGTYFGTAGAGVKSLTFNGGTLVCPGSGLAFNKSGINFSTVAGTGTGKISMTSASAKTFVGDGIVYNCTLENAGAGALTITGSNTFTTISNSVQPTSFLFTAGTTTTVTNFNVSGTSGNLVTIGSVTAASHTLSKSSGIVNVSYCTISYSTATGGAKWQAYTTNGNVNGGNNSGWLFSEFTANGLFFGSNF